LIILNLLRSNKPPEKSIEQGLSLTNSFLHMIRRFPTVFTKSRHKTPHRANLILKLLTFYVVHSTRYWN